MQLKMISTLCYCPFIYRFLSFSILSVNMPFYQAPGVDVEAIFNPVNRMLHVRAWDAMPGGTGGDDILECFMMVVRVKPGNHVPVAPFKHTGDSIVFSQAGVDIPIVLSIYETTDRFATQEYDHMLRLMNEWFISVV